VVGLALDCPLLWHFLRGRLRSCDLVLTDPPAAESLAIEGISQAQAANLHGCDRAFLDLFPATPAEDPEKPSVVEGNGAETRPSARNGSPLTTHKSLFTPHRDIDVLFVGNLNPAVQPERLPWLMRLARLGKRRRVVIQSGVFGDAYRKLLSRARIVFNHWGKERCQDPFMLLSPDPSKPTAYLVQRPSHPDNRVT
jgi:hypothetical protein